jgi:hypothetical protein
VFPSERCSDEEFASGIIPFGFQGAAPWAGGGGAGWPLPARRVGELQLWCDAARRQSKATHPLLHLRILGRLHDDALRLHKQRAIALRLGLGCQPLGVSLEGIPALLPRA